MEIQLPRVSQRGLQAGGLSREGKEHQPSTRRSPRRWSEAAVENALERAAPRSATAPEGLPAERDVRDSKLSSIGGVTTEIQKMIIAELMLA